MFGKLELSNSEFILPIDHPNLNAQTCWIDIGKIEWRVFISCHALLNFCCTNKVWWNRTNFVTRFESSQHLLFLIHNFMFEDGRRSWVMSYINFIDALKLFYSSSMYLTRNFFHGNLFKLLFNSSLERWKSNLFVFFIIHIEVTLNLRITYWCNGW